MPERHTDLNIRHGFAAFDYIICIPFRDDCRTLCIVISGQRCDCGCRRRGGLIAPAADAMAAHGGNAGKDNWLGGINGLYRKNNAFILQRRSFFFYICVEIKLLTNNTLPRRCASGAAAGGKRVCWALQRQRRFLSHACGAMRASHFP